MVDNELYFGKRAKQEHLNQKWKGKPDHTNCGEQDNERD